MDLFSDILREKTPNMETPFCFFDDNETLVETATSLGLLVALKLMTCASIDFIWISTILYITLLQNCTVTYYIVSSSTRVTNVFIDKHI